MQILENVSGSVVGCFGVCSFGRIACVAYIISFGRKILRDAFQFLLCVKELHECCRFLGGQKVNLEV